MVGESGHLFELTTAEIERALFSSGRCENAVRADMSALRSFYRWARDVVELVDVDPTARIERPKKRQLLPRPVSEDQYRRLLVESEARSARLHLIVALAGSAGLRCIEISRLRTCDIADGVIRVHGKGNKERLVPIGETCRRAIEAADVMGSPGRIYTYSPSEVSKVFGEFARSIGVQVTTHQLRHRFATAIWRETRDLLTLRDLLGHSDLSTTQIYLQLDTDSKFDAVASLPF